jgi:transcriptional regulator with XRE-family HTH domain
MGNTFGAFLKQKRQEKNLTQKDLAQSLIVSESAVSKWEKDVARPDIALLPKLSEILGVTEHELITASVDAKYREEKRQAKKWRTLSFSWSLFFYIAYGAAIIPCFICNLAIDKTLSWFWIVVAALILAFSFTNLPKLVKTNKLLVLPIASYLSLCLLLGVCCLYTHGNWFWIAAIAVLIGLVAIFLPIYVSRYPIFRKLKKYNDFFSLGILFLLLNILLLIINGKNSWYFSLGLPIALGIYIVVNLLFCIRFLRVNRWLKTSLMIGLCAVFIYLPPIFIRVENENLQRELDDCNILKANLLRWNMENVEQNVHCIIFLTLLGISVAFCIVGLIRRMKKSK